MLGFIEQKFITLVLLLSDFGRSRVKEYASLNNQTCTVKPKFIDLYLDELHY